MAIFAGLAFTNQTWAQDKSCYKSAKKEVKSLKKDGFKVPPGSLPMYDQMAIAICKAKERNDKDRNKFFIAPGQAVGSTKAAARMQAIELAKVEIAGLINSQVAGLVENNLGNSQLNEEEAESVTQSIQGSKSLIAQEISMIDVIFEAYRPMDNKNVDYAVQIAIDSDMAVNKAKKVIRKQLEDKADVLQGKIDKLMDF